MPTRWTAADIPDLTGRTAAVTGANSGLGLRTAEALAANGAAVLLGCRDPERGAAALEAVKAVASADAPTLVRLDLADLASVRDAAAAVDGLAGPGGLDILVNNAGVMALPRRTTADGFEMQFGTNHLGHFALTGELLPALLRAAAARVVTVSSHGHRIGRIRFDDLQGERRYSRWPAYGQSKLANLLFTSELARRASAAGTTLVAAAAHPGYSRTNLSAQGPSMAGSKLMMKAMDLSDRAFGQPDAIGALPQLYAATMPDVAGDDYFGPDGPFQTRGYPERVGRSSAARDAATASRLWDVSEALTGVTYRWPA